RGCGAEAGGGCWGRRGGASRFRVRSSTPVTETRYRACARRELSAFQMGRASAVPLAPSAFPPDRIQSRLGTTARFIILRPLPPGRLMALSVTDGAPSHAVPRYTLVQAGSHSGFLEMVRAPERATTRGYERYVSRMASTDMTNKIDIAKLYQDWPGVPRRS